MRSSRKLRKIGLTAAVGAVAFIPSSLFACAACYGRSDSPLASGMNWGIFTLLGVVLTVLTCIALFFVHVVRGEKAQSENDSAPKNPPDV